MAAQFRRKRVILHGEEARGLICLALPPSGRADLMAARTIPFETAFTVSIEAREESRPGSRRPTAPTRSGGDRSEDFRDVVQPGHVFAKARPGASSNGRALRPLSTWHFILKRPGRLQVMNEDGSMARADDLVDYCAHHAFRRSRSRT
jgi:3,4-dihydroxy 2-butanone 4-phosphate synthase/GTP cyclohydrolase II